MSEEIVIRPAQPEDAPQAAYLMYLSGPTRHGEGARQFYERMGFRAVKTVTDPRFCRRFGVRGSIRMVKYVNANANADR